MVVHPAVIPDTCSGVLLLIVVPSPSWPSSLAPQVHTVVKAVMKPLVSAATAESLPAAINLHIPEGRRDHTNPAETLRLHSLD